MSQSENKVEQEIEKRLYERFVKISGPAGLPREWMSLEHEGVQELKEMIKDIAKLSSEEVKIDLRKKLENMLGDTPAHSHTMDVTDKNCSMCIKKEVTLLIVNNM